MAPWRWRWVGFLRGAEQGLCGGRMRAESCFPHFSRLGHPCPRAGRSARNFWTACVVATVPLRRAVRHQL
eukprot:10166253-Prorocentrum_lima.AAC.1